MRGEVGVERGDDDETRGAHVHWNHSRGKRGQEVSRHESLNDDDKFGNEGGEKKITRDV